MAKKIDVADIMLHIVQIRVQKLEIRNAVRTKI